MKRLAVLLAAVMVSSAAFAACPADQMIQIGLDDPAENPVEVIRFEGLDLIYSYKGEETRFITGGNGSGINVRSAFNPDVHPSENGEFFEVDISRFAKPGAPDQLLIYHNGAYRPICRK